MNYLSERLLRSGRSSVQWNRKEGLSGVHENVRYCELRRASRAAAPAEVIRVGAVSSQSRAYHTRLYAR